MLSSRSPRHQICFVGLVILLIFFFVSIQYSESESPSNQTAEPLQYCEPSDLLIQEAVKEELDRPHFNDYSWKLFIALNWPATDRNQHRGEPDPTKPFGTPNTTVVWETWKSLDELFPPDPESTPPTEWDSYDVELAILSPKKGLTPGAGKRKILCQGKRLGTVEQSGFHASKLYPLIAQNGTYVRYEVRVNQIAYEYIRKNKFYLKDKFQGLVDGNTNRLAFPDGSIVVKAAWMEITKREDASRFHCTNAELEEFVEGSTEPTLRPAVVGLVGLHIAQKTPQRPSWIWSSFEHVDNTEPGPGAKHASFSKNDPKTIYGTNNVDHTPPKLQEGKPLPANPKPVDVERRNPVHSSTEKVSLRYQKSQSVTKTIWRYYRLIATQWVGNIDPGHPTNYEDLIKAKQIFPPGDVVNTTLETYRQTSSCFECHRTTHAFRFIFFPEIRAFSR